MSYYYDECEYYEPEPFYYEPEPVNYESEPVNYKPEPVYYESELTYDEPETAYDEPDTGYDEPQPIHYDPNHLYYDSYELEPEPSMEPASEIDHDFELQWNSQWDDLGPIPMPRYEDIHPMYLDPDWVPPTPEVQSTPNDTNLDGMVLESQQDNLGDSYHDLGGDNIKVPSTQPDEDLDTMYRHADHPLPTSGAQLSVETIYLLLRSQPKQHCSAHHPPWPAISSASNSRTRHHHAQDKPTQQRHPPRGKPPPAHIIPLPTPRKHDFSNPQMRPHRKHPPPSLPAAIAAPPNHQVNAARRISQKVA